MEPILYRALRPIICFVCKFFFRPEITGRENIVCGKVVLAGNHTSILDCLLLISCTNRTIHFLAKDELSKGFKRLLFNNMGLIYVNRRINDSNAYNNALRVLNNNQVIGIFPEGTINRTDKPTIPFKSGAIRMAKESFSPIVPFVITGRYKIFRKSVKISFGRPFYVKDEYHIENDKFQSLINKMIQEG